MAEPVPLAGLPIEELKAIAHPSRLRILQVLCESERNVGEIEEASAIGQPALSQQLAVLRQAGLVTTRREGKLVYYGVERAAFAPILECLAQLCGKDTRSKATGSNDPRTGGDEAQRTPSPGAAHFARVL